MQIVCINYFYSVCDNKCPINGHYRSLIGHYVPDKLSNRLNCLLMSFWVLYLFELAKLSNLKPQTSNHFEVISELILYCEYSANSYNSIIHKSSSIIQHFSPSICGVCIASITIRYILLYIVNS